MEAQQGALGREPSSLDTAGTWRLADVARIVAGALAVLALGVLLLRFGLRQFPSGVLSAQQPSVWLAAAMGALESVALIGSVYFLGIRWKRLGWRIVGLTPAQPQWLWSAVGISLLIIPLSGLVAAAIQAAVGQPVHNPQLPFIAPGGFSWFGMLSMLLLGGILAPLGEELLFRGVIYQWLRSRWGALAAALISALVFGAAHGDLAVGGVAALLGLVLAGIFEASGSLWPAIIIHILNNSIKILLLYILLAAGVQVS